MITLFYKREENSTTFITNQVKAIDLLNFLPSELEIEINSDFYATISYDDGKEIKQFIIDDVKYCKNIKDVKQFIESNKDIFIQTLSFSNKNYGLFFLSDEYELSMKLDISEKAEELIKKYLISKRLDLKLYQELKSNSGYYLIVNNKSIILNKFNDFDQFVKYSKKYHI